MKKILILIILTILTACASVKPIVQNKIIYKDSTILRFDTIYVDIPKQSYFNYTSFKDTLYLNTDIASAYAYVDFNKKILKGGIKNKDSVKLKKEVIYKEKIITRDSIIEIVKEVPIDKPIKIIPKFYRFTLGYFIITILIIVIYIFLKLKL